MESVDIASTQVEKDKEESETFDITGDRPKTFADIKGAIIDTEGRFKYIQIVINNTETSESKTIVRAYK